MNRCLVLDSEAIAALAGRPGRNNRAHRDRSRHGCHIEGEMMLPKADLNEKETVAKLKALF